ncbi:MAG: hypothetical protein EOP04_09395 [Proteobacteria bacterium]|nr:MAG: hypothetical protein EOP04_09395 [Pseudomonadota bacterium]
MSFFRCLVPMLACVFSISVWGEIPNLPQSVSRALCTQNPQSVPYKFRDLNRKRFEYLEQAISRIPTYLARDPLAAAFIAVIPNPIPAQPIDLLSKFREGGLDSRRMKFIATKRSVSLKYDGKSAGDLVLHFDEGSATHVTIVMVTVPPEFQRKSIGTALYLIAARLSYFGNGQLLSSSSTIMPGAISVWENFVRLGYAQKVSSDAFGQTRYAFKPEALENERLYEMLEDLVAVRAE